MYGFWLIKNGGYFMYYSLALTAKSSVSLEKGILRLNYLKVAVFVLQIATAIIIFLM